MMHINIKVPRLYVRRVQLHVLGSMKEEGRKEQETKGREGVLKSCLTDIVQS